MKNFVGTMQNRTTKSTNINEPIKQQKKPNKHEKPTKTTVTNGKMGKRAKMKGKDRRAIFQKQL